MRLAQFKYERAMSGVVYKPGRHFFELLDPALITGARRFQLFSSFKKQVRRHFRHPSLVALMEFPVLFLGAMAADTPALYTLMNYAGLKLGTWYPEGGFGGVARAVAGLAERKGASVRYNSEVSRILVKNGAVTGLHVKGQDIDYDGVVASADYSYVEEMLLPSGYQNYDPGYWEKKTFAPSCLIFYLGLRKQFPKLAHHTLFFEEDLDRHAIEIYKKPGWPSRRA